MATGELTPSGELWAGSLGALLASRELTGLTVAALYFALILLLLAAVFHLARLWRRGGLWFARIWKGGATGRDEGAHGLLSRYRELHARGGLSDDEYRTIKTKLATQLRGADLDVAERAGGSEA